MKYKLADTPHHAPLSCQRLFTMRGETMQLNKPAFARMVAIAAILTTLLGCGVQGQVIQGIAEYNEGVQYMQAGQSDLAEQKFKSAVQKNPDLAEAHLNLGKIYLERGWNDGAEASTKRAIELFERTRITIAEGYTWQQSASIAYGNMGVIEFNRASAALSQLNYSSAKDHCEKSMSYLKKAVELDPLNSYAQGNIEQFETFCAAIR